MLPSGVIDTTDELPAPPFRGHDQIERLVAIPVDPPLEGRRLIAERRVSFGRIDDQRAVFGVSQRLQIEPYPDVTGIADAPLARLGRARDSQDDAQGQQETGRP